MLDCLLKLVNQSLVAVNAGSNTLSMFKIDERDATKLVMVGQPVSTMGDFPVTVAASESLRQGGSLGSLGVFMYSNLA